MVTTVPLFTKELASTYPFLREDFAPGGVLEGKEIYAFVPSTLTVVEGDTVRFTFGIRRTTSTTSSSPA